MDLQQAKKKIMDYVAQRDHSELELRLKLEPICNALILDQALSWALQQKWLASPDQLKEKLAEFFHSKGQAVSLINEKLATKGLPAIESTFQSELIKAKTLATSKFSLDCFKSLSFAEASKLKAKILRFLAARGYELEMIEQILIEDFKAGAVSHENE